MQWGAIRIEAVQDGFQEFSETSQVHMLVGVEQPANFGDKGGLDGVGIDIMPKVLDTWAKAGIEFFWRGIVGSQNTDIHPVSNFLGAKSLNILADSSI